MSLSVDVDIKKPGVLVISPSGSLDTNTYSILEKEVDKVLSSSPIIIIFDLKDLQYISSLGVRVIFKTKKRLKQGNGEFLMINLQPQIKKVFDIINAIPYLKIFESIEELDSYLDAMQKKET